MSLFRERYRVESTRLRDHDYSAGRYHVVICTRSRQSFFGEVRNGIVGLSYVGCTAHQCWEAIPGHFPHVRLDVFQVMPNHLHGILRLMPRPAETRRDTALPKSTSDDNSMAAVTPDSGSLGIIVNQYKGAVTRCARRNGLPDFGWQPRFFDQLIRSKRQLDTLRRYIVENPSRWDGGVPYM